jgi:hypothetical protein
MLVQLLDFHAITPTTALCKELADHRPEGIDVLLDLLKYTPAVDVKKRRIQLLYELGDNLPERGIAAIVDAVHDKDLAETVKSSAITSLLRQGPATTNKLVPQLRQIVNDPKSETWARNAAKAILEKIPASNSTGAKAK